MSSGVYFATVSHNEKELWSEKDKVVHRLYSMELEN